LVIKRIPSDRY